MKITKKQLREIIKEELNKLKNNSINEAGFDIYKFDKKGILTHVKSMGKWNNKFKKISVDGVDYFRNDNIGGWVSKQDNVLTKKLLESKNV